MDKNDEYENVTLYGCKNYHRYFYWCRKKEVQPVGSSDRDWWLAGGPSGGCADFVGTWGRSIASRLYTDHASVGWGKDALARITLTRWLRLIHTEALICPPQLLPSLDHETHHVLSKFFLLSFLSFSLLAFASFPFFFAFVFLSSVSLSFFCCALFVSLVKPLFLILFSYTFPSSLYLRNCLYENVSTMVLWLGVVGSGLAYNGLELSDGDECWGHMQLSVCPFPSHPSISVSRTIKASVKEMIDYKTGGTVKLQKLSSSYFLLAGVSLLTRAFVIRERDIKARFHASVSALMTCSVCRDCWHSWIHDAHFFFYLIFC